MNSSNNLAPKASNFNGGPGTDQPAGERWETLKDAAERVNYSYQTFKNWKCQGRLPFPVYRNNLVRPTEVDAWIASERISPCLSSVGKVKIEALHA
jgi:hypothetical protein